MGKERIILKVMLVIKHDGKILAGKGYDEVKGEHFYRLLGGSVHFQETSEEAIKREIMEELNSEIENLELLDTVENLFVYNGEKGHHICFIYGGELADKTLLDKEKIRIVEDTHEFNAHWVSIKDLIKNKIPVYPEIDPNLLR